MEGDDSDLEPIEAHQPPESPPPALAEAAVPPGERDWGLGLDPDGGFLRPENIIAAEIARLVHERVEQRRREGTWGEVFEEELAELRRTAPPRIPPNPKDHWDFLLEEMMWMAKIFSEERVIKEKVTKKCARMIQTYFKDECNKYSRLATEEERQRRRVALDVSKMVRRFWSNAETVAWYKMHALYDIARRRSLDEKLNQVLTSSEKFVEEVSAAALLPPDDDQDFDPAQAELSDTDQEDTIALEERMAKLNENDYAEELKELEDEKELSFEQLVAKYSGYLGLDETEDPDIGTRKRKRGAVEPAAERELRPRRKRGRPAAAEKPAEENNNGSEEEENLGLDVLVQEEVENFQPLGHTLSATKVTTKVPHLMRYELREYQHIGLDWLANLYERKLNGILADEMGLGKTIQTIALLAYLAVEKGNWGPHLIIVPTSLIMNWEQELIKWCPSFKLLTYFGSQKLRKEIRTGWSVPNSFHICITSYTLAVQDHRCFRRKPWQYMILDEAHNIKNFKSQRWQVLLNFNSERRLLLTGTPLQNNLMELWSLLHFLMPHVFESHSEFKEWFSKPIEEITAGSREYNERIVKQFHKTLRPFILRRLKSEVEKQMPKKVEHVIKCSLSKRQRLLYEEFMARSDTRKSIYSGRFLNVLNVLMQLRKVCNHPDLFEPRPVISPYPMEVVTLSLPKCVWHSIPPTDVHELMNTRFLGRKSYESTWESPDPEMIFEPKMAARLEFDEVTGKKRLNVAVDPLDMPRPDHLFRFEKGYWIDVLVDDPMEAEPEGAEVTKEAEEASSQTESYLDSLTDSYSQDTLASLDEDMNSEVISVDEDYDFHLQVLPTHPQEMILEYVTERMNRDKVTAVAKLERLNQRRSQTCSLLDAGMISTCTIIGKLPSFRHAWRKSAAARAFSDLRSYSGFWNGGGYAEVALLSHLRTLDPNLIHHPYFLWRFTKTLAELVPTMPQVFEKVILDYVRFLFYIPAVSISVKECPVEKTYSPATATLQYRSVKNRDLLKSQLSKQMAMLHPIASRLQNLFPDPHLVEFDCGKLQVLNGLLRNLKREGHKVLLFTQMSKMLNILEYFLNLHGHRYLRMDGATKVGTRQLLVDRFNKDPKIFCFLLSTRAGGLGINLTGADTVIFYDSDWNPTIDAQAQDRCHRIGQTRDVHIYRLISENSVEENILKKSSMKKLLGEHAIEEGRFNLDLMKRESFRDIFNLPHTDVPPLQSESEEPLSNEALEKALAAAEDVEDRKAAAAATKEIEANRQEFLEEGLPSKTEMDIQKLQDDFSQVLSLVNGVERYAMLVADAELNNWSPAYIEETMQTLLESHPEKDLSATSSQVDNDDDMQSADGEMANDNQSQGSISSKGSSEDSSPSENEESQDSDEELSDKSDAHGDNSSDEADTDDESETDYSSSGSSSGGSLFEPILPPSRGE